MATTDTLSFSLSTSVGSLSGMSGTDSETGNTALTGSQLAFSANSNSAALAMSFNAAAVQSIFLLSTQNCTIKTNDSTSPTNTLSLVAGIPLYWGRSSGYFAQPLNANTNAAFVTCNAALILNMRILTS